MSTFLSIGAVNGYGVRFFAPPRGKPDMPWHSLEDLHRCANLTRGERKAMLAHTKKSWCSDLRTIRHDGETVVVAPHFVAQGFLGAMVQVGKITSKVEQDYALAGSGALEALIAQFGLSKEDRIKWAFAAAFGENAPDVAVDLNTGLAHISADQLRTASGMTDEEIQDSMRLGDGLRRPRLVTSEVMQ